MITVAIIEDNRLVREGMTDMLNELPDVTVVLASTSFEAEMLKELNPRVVLLDVGLQDKNSLRLAEAVQKEMADARVIVMDLLPVHEEIAEFVNAGVAGFILKDATFDNFLGTIRSVADGVRVLPPCMTGTLFSQIARAAVSRGTDAALEAVRMTQREREVIALIASGSSNKEIAQNSASPRIQSRATCVESQGDLSTPDRAGRRQAVGTTGRAERQLIGHLFGRANRARRSPFMERAQARRMMDATEQVH
ncbi:MAG: response regulator transcription factor [bacterium]